LTVTLVRVAQRLEKSPSIRQSLSSAPILSAKSNFNDPQLAVTPFIAAACAAASLRDGVAGSHPR
jgi:hypothetical protein